MKLACYSLMWMPLHVISCSLLIHIWLRLWTRTWILFDNIFFSVWLSGIDFIWSHKHKKCTCALSPCKKKKKLRILLVADISIWLIIISIRKSYPFIVYFFFLGMHSTCTIFIIVRMQKFCPLICKSQRL